MRKIKGINKYAMKDIRKMYPDEDTFESAPVWEIVAWQYIMSRNYFNDKVRQVVKNLMTFRKEIRVDYMEYITLSTKYEPFKLLTMRIPEETDTESYELSDLCRNLFNVFASVVVEPISAMIDPLVIGCHYCDSDATGIERANYIEVWFDTTKDMGGFEWDKFQEFVQEHLLDQNELGSPITYRSIKPVRYSVHKYSKDYIDKLNRINYAFSLELTTLQRWVNIDPHQKQFKPRNYNGYTPQSNPFPPTYMPGGDPYDR